MPKPSSLLAPLALLTLSACSPHPSSGEWLPVADNPSGFSRIDVQFEGRADFYQEGQEEAVRRCFWGGASQTTARMTCVVAADTEREETYLLSVGKDGRAELSLNGNSLGFFVRRLPQ